MNTRNYLGFTLIELLIVIAILSILSTLGLNNFRTARTKASDLNRKSDLQTIAKSLEAYANDHSTYPLADANNKIICRPPNGSCIWGSPFTDGTSTYLTILPGNAGNQNYIYESNGKTYTIYAHLENPNDQDIVTIEPADTALKCGSATLCNYKLSSTNK